MKAPIDYDLDCVASRVLRVQEAYITRFLILLTKVMSGRKMAESASAANDPILFSRPRDLERFGWMSRTLGGCIGFSFLSLWAAGLLEIYIETRYAVDTQDVEI